MFVCIKHQPRERLESPGSAGTCHRANYRTRMARQHRRSDMAAGRSPAGRVLAAFLVLACAPSSLPILLLLGTSRTPFRRGSPGHGLRRTLWTVAIKRMHARSEHSAPGPVAVLALVVSARLPIPVLGSAERFQVPALTFCQVALVLFAVHTAPPAPGTFNPLVMVSYPRWVEIRDHVFLLHVALG